MYNTRLRRMPPCPSPAPSKKNNLCIVSMTSCYSGTYTPEYCLNKNLHKCVFLYYLFIISNFFTISNFCTNLPTTNTPLKERIPTSKQLVTGINHRTPTVLRLNMHLDRFPAKLRNLIVQDEDFRVIRRHE